MPGAKVTIDVREVSHILCFLCHWQLWLKALCFQVVHQCVFSVSQCHCCEIWYICPLWLKDALIRFGWPKVKGHCEHQILRMHLRDFLQIRYTRPRLLKDHSEGSEVKFNVTSQDTLLVITGEYSHSDYDTSYDIWIVKGQLHCDIIIFCIIQRQVWISNLTGVWRHTEMLIYHPWIIGIN